MKKDIVKNKIVIYQTKSGAIELKADIAHDTIWATQAQVADIFNIERSVITKHIGNILKDKEVDEKSNVQKMHIANSDKPVSFYSLDIILSLGYRVNSLKAIAFRQWATKTLRQYITNGYVINKNRIAENYSQFIEAVDNIKKFLPTGARIDNANVLELVSAFADTWLSLESYDKDKLKISGATKKEVALTAEKLAQVLSEFKSILMNKKEATELFGKERQNNAIAGIVGNVMQSFGGKKLYPTVEEKAAHLLYFIVKNHPFVDGNKRSGAYAFVWFLRQAKILDAASLTPPALTALTILVAESNPKDKEKIIHLVLTLLAKNKKFHKSF